MRARMRSRPSARSTTVPLTCSAAPSSRGRPQNPEREVGGERLRCIHHQWSGQLHPVEAGAEHTACGVGPLVRRPLAEVVGLGVVGVHLERGERHRTAAWKTPKVFASQVASQATAEETAVIRSPSGASKMAVTVFCPALPSTLSRSAASARGCGQQGDEDYYICFNLLFSTLYFSHYLTKWVAT